MKLFWINMLDLPIHVFDRLCMMVGIETRRQRNARRVSGILFQMGITMAGLEFTSGAETPESELNPDQIKFKRDANRMGYKVRISDKI